MADAGRLVSPYLQGVLAFLVVASVDFEGCGVVPTLDTKRCSRRVVVVMVDDSGTPDLVVPGLTVQRKVPVIAMQAQLIGTLEIDPSTNCLVVRMDVSPAVGKHEVLDVDVAWPLGWSVAIRDGEIALIDAAGQTTHKLGDEVWVGGGFVAADRANVVPCTGREHVFEASGFSGP